MGETLGLLGGSLPVRREPGARCPALKWLPQAEAPRGPGPERTEVQGGAGSQGRLLSVGRGGSCFQRDKLAACALGARRRRTAGPCWPPSWARSRPSPATAPRVHVLLASSKKNRGERVTTCQLFLRSCFSDYEMKCSQKTRHSENNKK